MLTKTNGQQNKTFIIFSVLILTMGLFFNPSKAISKDGQDNFDWYSNGIIITDLMYRDHFDDPGLCLKRLPHKIQGGTDIAVGQNAEQTIPEMFANGETFSKETFINYTSNIVIHRYGYAFLNRIAPLPKLMLLNALYWLNCFLLAVMATIILFWIKEKTSMAIACVLLLLLALTAPYFGMSGRNLYWASWTLFMPMSAMIVLLKSKKYRSLSNRSKIRWLTLSAFFTCAIKQLCYFEFVSTTMVAMAIPVIYELLETKERFSQVAKTLGFLVLAAVLSFVFANAVRLTLLSIEYGALSEAYEIIRANLVSRVFGNLHALDERTLMSAEAGVAEVLAIMAVRPAFSIKTVFTISMFTLCILTAVVSACELLYLTRNKTKKASSMSPLIASTWISLIAPLSWFILAKPHTYIHRTQAALTWFIPFALLASAWIIDFLFRIASLLFSAKQSKNKMLQRLSGEKE